MRIQKDRQVTQVMTPMTCQSKALAGYFNFNKVINVNVEVPPTNLICILQTFLIALKKTDDKTKQMPLVVLSAIGGIVGVVIFNVHAPTFTEYLLSFNYNYTTAHLPYPHLLTNKLPTHTRFEGWTKQTLHEHQDLTA